MNSAAPQSPRLPRPRTLSLAIGLAASLAAAGCQTQIEPDFPQAPFEPVVTLPRAAAPAPQLLPPPGPAAETAALASPSTDPADALRNWTDWEADRSLPGILRSQRAQAARLPVVKELFAKAGVPFPPAQMAFVAYKKEKQLEVWASAESGGQAKRIATYGVCAASGGLGPKRYEGDRQVPEGYYVIQYGWAESAYHLEMKVSLR